MDVFSLAYSVAITFDLGWGREERKEHCKSLIVKWYHRRAVFVLWVFRSDSFSDGTFSWVPHLFLETSYLHFPWWDCHTLSFVSLSLERSLVHLYCLLNSIAVQEVALIGQSMI